MRGRLIDKLVDAPEAVEQAELGVHMEMREVVGSQGHGALMVAGRRVAGGARKALPKAPNAAPQALSSVLSP